MSLSSGHIDRLADALFEAERTGVAIDKPSDGVAIDVDDAYAIQQRNISRRHRVCPIFVFRKCCGSDFGVLW